jgi:hypothetical protein
MRRPDLHTIMQESYACGLPRHWKDTRALIDYIGYLEQQLEQKENK